MYIVNKLCNKCLLLQLSSNDNSFTPHGQYEHITTIYNTTKQEIIIVVNISLFSLSPVNSNNYRAPNIYFIQKYITKH